MIMLFDAMGLHPLYELGSVVSIIALLMRRQLALRFVLLVASALLIANNFVGDATVSYESAVWNGLNFLINLYVLMELIYGRTTLWFSAEDRELFNHMGNLTPGEFRKLMRLSARRCTDGETTITVEGSAVDKLFFVYDGAITISKAGRETPLSPRSFIGEIAFLNQGPASASVRVAAQSRWIEWPAPALRRQLDRDNGLRMVIMRLIGEDLARKVARA